MKTIDAKISTDCEEVKLVDVVQHSQREQLIEGLRSSMKFIREREELKGIEHGTINFRNELKVELGSRNVENFSSAQRKSMH